MVDRSIFLLILLNFSNIYCAKFRFDYTYVKSVEGWLKLHQVPLAWSDARLLCHAEGAVLASPLTPQIYDKMVEYASARSIHSIHTGVHSTFSKGSYASIEGVPLMRIPIRWAQGEPDNFQNSENCLAMLTYGNGTMKDVPCTDVYPFICYKKRTHTLVVTGCGTHDTEYNLDKRTGRCYKLHRRGLTWSQAHMTCMAEGGHLVIINSDQEEIVVQELYAKYPDAVMYSKYPYVAFIGIFDAKDGGSWMTIHGETLTEAGSARWLSGQPDNGTQPSGEFCGVIDRNSRNYINDFPCHWQCPFICEKAPESLLDSEEIEL